MVTPTLTAADGSSAYSHGLPLKVLPARSALAEAIKTFDGNPCGYALLPSAAVSVGVTIAQAEKKPSAVDLKTTRRTSAH